MMESFWCFHGQTQNIFVHFEPHQHPHQDIQMSTYKSQHTQARSFYLFLKKSTVEQTPFSWFWHFFLKNNHKTIDRGWWCLSEIQQGMKWLFFWRCEKLCVYFYSTYISSKYHKNFVVCLNDWYKWDSHHHIRYL